MGTKVRPITTEILIGVLSLLIDTAILVVLLMERWK